MIKQKGLKEYLEEDETLTTPLTYEEFNRVENGFDDSGIEKAYKSYKEFVSSNREAAI